MTEPDIHMLTGVYALDALDETERRSFERHLAECPACQAEVAELSETAARLGAGADVPLPPRLRADVLAAAAETPQLPPLPAVSAIGQTRAPQPLRWFQQPAAVAAALLLVVAGVLGAVAVNALQRAQEAEQRAERIAAIATDPEGVRLSRPVSSGGHGTVIAAGGSAVLRTSDIERLPSGQVYQLWILRGDTAQSAGILGRGGELEALVDGMRPDDALGVTIEPSDGSTRPTGELVFRAQMA